ncbi:hypothetical protein BH09ACT11_BH09ACT11_17650 [soil metagenome]
MTLVLLAAGCGTVGSSGPQAAEEHQPLSKYLGFGHHPIEEEIQFNDDEMARERLIAECMVSKGFEYTPEPAGIVLIGDGTGEPVELGEDPAPAERANFAYVESLPRDEAGAYWLALTNRDSANDGITKEEMSRLDPNGDGRISYEESLDDGCRGRATAAVPGVFYVQRVLGEDFDALQRDIDTQRQAAMSALRQCASGVQSLQARDDRELLATVEAVAGADVEGTQVAAECLGQFESSLAASVAELERDFYNSHATEIAKFAVPFPG